MAKIKTTDNLFDFYKINLIIQLAKSNIEKSGSYRIACKLNEAEITELSKQFTIQHLYDLKNVSVYLLKSKQNARTSRNHDHV